jgi:hypothetical protein
MEWCAFVHYILDDAKVILITGNVILEIYTFREKTDPWNLDLGGERLASISLPPQPQMIWNLINAVRIFKGLDFGGKRIDLEI